jgi:hypothetical protein
MVCFFFTCCATMFMFFSLTHRPISTRATFGSLNRQSRQASTALQQTGYVLSSLISNPRHVLIVTIQALTSTATTVNANTLEDPDTDTNSKEDKSDDSDSEAVNPNADEESDAPPSENGLTAKVDTTTTLAWCISQYKAPKADTVKGKLKWKWQCWWCRCISLIPVVMHVTDAMYSKFRRTDRSVDITDYTKETIDLKSTGNFMTHHTTECKSRPSSNTLTRFVEAKKRIEAGEEPLSPVDDEKSVQEKRDEISVYGNLFLAGSPAS